MKKIFFFMAAMLITMSVWATKWSISPTAHPGWSVTQQALEVTITNYATTDGDTIELTDGTYIEPYSINLNNSLVIMAAENATPVLKRSSYFGAYASVKFIGVTFDGDNTAEYALYVQSSDAKGIIFENCEFYGFTKDVITGSSSKANLDSCFINNCYFHNNTRSAVKFETSSSRTDGKISCNLLKVTNSTITNVTALSGALIDNRNNANESGTDSLYVDHVTIYNWVGGENAAIMSYKSHHAGIYNSIIALPTSAELYATQLYGGYISNCIMYNNKGIKSSSKTTNTNIWITDPLFVNPSTGNYSFGAGSPALNAATDGTHLGDPRWWGTIKDVESITLNKKTLSLDIYDYETLSATILPDDAANKNVTWTSSNPAIATVSEEGLVTAIEAGTTNIIAMAAGDHSDTCVVTVVIPSTDFTTPYFLEGKKAKLDGKIRYNDTDSLHYYDTQDKGTATWRIHALNSCRIQGTVNYKLSSSSGTKFRIEIYDDENNLVGDSLTMNRWDGNGDRAMDGSILLPKAGDYTIIAYNFIPWSAGQLRGFTLSMVDRPAVSFKGDFGDSWAGHAATLANDGLSASATISLGVFTEKEFGVMIGEDFRANGYGYHRDFTGADGITGNAGNMKLTTDYVGDYIFTWYFETNAISITFPEKTLIDGFYLIGPDWNTASLRGKFEEHDPGVEWKLSTTLAAGDKIKVVYVENGGIKEWYPSGEGTEYTVDSEHAGTVNIYTKGNSYIDAWSSFGGYFYIEKTGETTSVSDIEQTIEAQKIFQNGQIYIIRDGKKYTVLGMEVR